MKLQQLAAIGPWDWPEDASTILRQALRDKQAAEEDRVLAAELAGEIPTSDEPLTDALMATIADAADSDELRARAAIALGPLLEYMDTEVEDDTEYAELPISPEKFEELRVFLRKMHRDANVPTDVRRAALEAAVRSPQDWHPAAIRAAYASGDAKWRLTAVFCMAYVKGFEDEILASLDSDDLDIKRNAVNAAGNWEIPDAWPEIDALLAADRDTPKPLLLAAIRASTGVRPDLAPESLEPFMDDSDEDIEEAVGDAMAMVEGAAFLDAEYGDEDGEDDEN